MAACAKLTVPAAHSLDMAGRIRVSGRLELLTTGLIVASDVPDLLRLGPIL